MDWETFGATLFGILGALLAVSAIAAVTSPITSGDGRTALWAIPCGILCALFFALCAGLAA